VRIPLDALPCQRHGPSTLRLPAFRILYLLGLAKQGERRGKTGTTPEFSLAPFCFALHVTAFILRLIPVAKTFWDHAQQNSGAKARRENGSMYP
jgi:hypothetical protein